MFVLHIGLKKSGSASIQTFLAANQKALATLSIDYPTVGRGTRKAHHNLAHDAMGGAKFDPFQGSLAQLAGVTNGWATRVMVSSEMFEGCDAAAVGRVKACLTDAAREFRIVLIIRDLLDLLPSSYAQKIRYGLNSFDFDTFFERRITEARVDYFETANRWADTFGWEAIKVRPLDARFLKNGDLIDDFLDAAGVDLLDPRVRSLERPGAVNAAAGWKVLEALRALYSGRHGLPADHLLMRNWDPARDRRKGKIIEAAAREVGDPMGWNTERARYYTRAQAERVLDIYSAAIKALNARLPVVLPDPSSLEDRGFVDREFVPDAAQIAPGDLRAFYDALANLVAGGPLDIGPAATPGPNSERESPPAISSRSAEDLREARRAARQAERRAERTKERAGG